MIRFIHSSDLHLGKPFGRFPEDVRGILKLARQNVVGRLATLAKEHGASHIMLAGDSFDAETPPARVIRQFLNTIREASELTWILLPGNHDSLAATELWRVLERDRPDNLILATKAEPVQLDGAVVLPAPCTARDPGRDLTAWMDSCDTGGDIRIGLGHGSIRDFRSLVDIDATQTSGVIAPDRSDLAALDYLALGDWHGRIQVNPKTYYSGAPEPDNFKDHIAASCLLVEIAEKGAAPTVQGLETGEIRWVKSEIDLNNDDDVAAVVQQALPNLSARNQCLMTMRLTGRLSLAQRQALVDALDAVAADFLHFERDLGRITLLQDVSDLDKIDTSGALRLAAETLAAEAAQGDDISSDALARLFAYAQGTS